MTLRRKCNLIFLKVKKLSKDFWRSDLTYGVFKDHFVEVIDAIIFDEVSKIEGLKFVFLPYEGDQI
jgi:hypothetical protein